MAAPEAPALDALLTKYRIDLTAGEVLEELDAAFATLPGPAALSQAEVEFLRAHAGPSAQGVIAAWSPDGERQDRARTALQHLTSTLSNSASIKEAASILGVDRSRVSRRITGKTLWAFDLRAGKRIPRWQFVGDTLLPGLDIVVPAIPDGLDPVVLEAFMHAAQPDLGGRAPLEHLAAGGDPTLIAGLVADLGRW